jgi:hypothetical protein
MLVDAPSYVLRLLWSLLYGVFASRSPWPMGSLALQLATVLFHLWLMRLARGQLHKEIAGAEPLSMGQVFADTWPRVAAAIRHARQWQPSGNADANPPER